MVQGVGGEGIGGFVTCTVQVKYIMHFPPCVAFQTTALCHFQRCFIWRPALSPAAEATAELSAGLQNFDLDLPLRPHSNFNRPLRPSVNLYLPLCPRIDLHTPLRWPVTSLSPSKSFS